MNIFLSAYGNVFLFINLGIEKDVRFRLMGQKNELWNCLKRALDVLKTFQKQSFV